MVESSFESALSKLSNLNIVNEIFVIGGVSLFEMSVRKYSEYCKLLMVTRINKNFECDVFMPEIDEVDKFSKIFVSKTYSHKDVTFDYCFYGNK